ncbi:MAG: DUF952 domain-containing protein [Chloroflexi bacterium]|nr:DUF952 domain-containing protein [Chloroflexota bacterium]
MIYHIARQEDWQAAQRAGSYQTDSLASQGFIHCSTREQVTRVANAIFRGQRDLVLLVIAPGKLAVPLKFEPPVHPETGQPETGTGEQFPHIYGAINLDAVVQVLPFLPDATGVFTLPEA